VIGVQALSGKTGSNWGPAPAEFILRGDEVHVSFASLAQSPKVESELVELLSHDERLRAERFFFERDKRRFIAARALLRIMLAGYLGANPDSLVFSYGVAGKPALAGRWAGALDFNVSHSTDGVLYAIATGRAVGVDLEYIRPLHDMAEIAARVLSRGEQEIFSNASPAACERMFYEFWTRKEAFIKAMGYGLSFPVQQLDVTLPFGQPSRLVTICDTGSGNRNWTLCSLAPEPAYAAALVVEGEASQIRIWQWPGT
jgi:4'-phosphopantetheinyl transferase